MGNGNDQTDRIPSWKFPDDKPNIKQWPKCEWANAQ